MPVLIRALSALFFFLLLQPLQSQDPAYHIFTVDQGLPSNQQFYLHQNSGRLWVGTDQGLASFNGRTFKTYPSPSTSSKAISPVVEDADGTIWCGNFYGQIFYLEHDSLKEFKHPYQTAGVVIKLAVNHKTNTVYANTSHGILVYEKARKTHHEIRIPNDGFVINLALNAEGNLLVISSKNIYILKGDHYQLLHYNPDLFLSEKIVMRKLYPFQIGADFYVFNSFTKSTYKVSKDSLIKHSAGFFGNEISGAVNFVYQKNGIVYCCMTSGLYLYKPGVPVDAYFKSYNISNALIDEEGSLWSSTLNKGLIYVPELATMQVKFENYEPNPEIYRVFATENMLLAGLSNGRVAKLNEGTNTIGNFLDFQDNDPVSCMTGDTAGHWLYMGSENLHRYNLRSKELQNQSGISIKDLSFFGGTLFLSDPSGLFGYYQNQPVIPIPRGADSVKNNSRFFPRISLFNESRSICHLFVPETREMWNCGVGKLSVYTKGYEKEILYPGGKPILGSCLAGWHKTVLCGTTYGGVVFIENHKVVRVLNTFNGLLSNSIKKVRVFGDQLLIICNKGVSIYNMKTGDLKHFTPSEGVISKELFDACIYQGYLFTGTASGLFKTKLGGTFYNAVAPRLRLNGISVNGNRMDGALKDLNYDENNISVFVDAIAFKANGLLKVEYLLRTEGTKDVWQAVGNNQEEIRFNSLSPGTYELFVRAFNEDGVQGQILTVRAFTIHSPLWTRWWFIGLLLLFAALLFYAFYRYRLHKQQTENRLQYEKELVEKELQNTQLSSLKVQMNPHFMFNALNSIQEFILTNEKRLANQYLGKFSDLMRMTLDMSQEDKVLLADELKALKLYLELEELRFGGELKVSMNIDAAVNPDDIYLPPLLIQPYVENALKHGLLHRKNDKQLSISFWIKPGETVLVCKIDDNGIGRARSEEIKQFRQKTHRSFASGATHKRLDLLNRGRANAISLEYRDKINANGESDGTTVIMEIPF